MYVSTKELEEERQRLWEKLKQIDELLRPLREAEVEHNLYPERVPNIDELRRKKGELESEHSRIHTRFVAVNNELGRRKRGGRQNGS